MFSCVKKFLHSFLGKLFKLNHRSLTLWWKTRSSLSPFQVRPTTLSRFLNRTLWFGEQVKGTMKAKSWYAVHNGSWKSMQRKPHYWFYGLNSGTPDFKQHMFKICTSKTIIQPPLLWGVSANAMYRRLCRDPALLSYCVSEMSLNVY